MLLIACAELDRARRPDRGDAVASDGQFARVGLAAAAIEDQCVAEYMIMLWMRHGGTLAKSVFL
jgi:hypothetical protein